MERKRLSSTSPHARVAIARVATAKIPAKSENLDNVLDANIIIAKAGGLRLQRTKVWASP